MRAVTEVCAGMEHVGTAASGADAVTCVREIGVENRLPEFIEEALSWCLFPRICCRFCGGLSQAAPNIWPTVFSAACGATNATAWSNWSGTGVAGISSCARFCDRATPAGCLGGRTHEPLDVPTLLELLPSRMPEWNRFYHDIVVRQIAYGAATDRGRTLLELLEILDPLVLPQAVDEIGMSGDRTAAPPLMVMAKPGEAAKRSPLCQAKAIESLGRLRESESVPVLRNCWKPKKCGSGCIIANCASPLLRPGQDRSPLRYPGIVR